MTDDYSFDEVNKSLEKLNKLLIDAEKRTEKLLDLFEAFAKASSMMGGGNNQSRQTDEIFRRLNKKTEEFYKQTDYMISKRKELINTEIEGIRQSDKERQERTKQLVLLRRDNNMMVEHEKTKRQQIRMVTKFMGGSGGGLTHGLSGFIGAGAGLLQGQSVTGGMGAGEKLGGLQQRIMNYQKNIGVRQGTMMGSPTGSESDFGKTLMGKFEKKFPKLSKAIVGTKSEEGGREGGALGKAAGGIGAAGGMMGMAGGMAGGMIGGAIMKGLEASPMFQAISKIMNQAFNLILRPIGDFFGAVFKPISIVLMKWGAVNLRKWAQSMQDKTNDAMKAADMIGKGLVAFFNDPLKFLGAALEQLGANIKAAIWGGEAEDILGTYINSSYTGIVAELDKQLGNVNGQLAKGAGVLSGLETTAANATKDTKEAQAKAQEKLDKIAENTSKTTPFGGFSSAEEQQKTLEEEIKKNMANPEYEKWFKGTWMEKQYGNKEQSTEEDPQFKRASELAGVSAETWASLSEESKKIYESYLDYKQGAYDTIEANNAVQAVYLEFAKQNSEKETTLSQIHAVNMEIQRTSYGVMKEKIKGSEGDMKKIKETTKNMSDRMKETFDYVLKKIEEMKAQALAASKSKSSSSKSGKAGGGLINERIFGIGERTGNEYLFGESGREYVVPESKSGGLGNITINVNVAKISSDVDLMKLKPLIERAILETHARRGII